MNLVEASLARIAGDLDAVAQRWVLIGGLAISTRVEPRFTRDVDVAVAVSDDHSAEALVRALMARGYGVAATIEQEATGRLATVRLVPPHARADEVVVDVLFASSGIEQEIVMAAQVLDVLPGLRVPVARIGDLIALKILARDDHTRPQDAADLRALRRVVSPEELDRASAMLSLISARGFDRGRDLGAAFVTYAADEG